MIDSLLNSLNWRSLIDILLVLTLLYQLYKLVRGSLAVNILLGLVAIYMLYMVVDALELRLLAKILGQFIGVGVISLIILFQPEIRRFLLMIGKNAAFSSNRGWIRRLFTGQVQSTEEDFNYVQEAVNAAWRLAQERTGMLIVFARTSELQFFANTGEAIDAKISSRLLESIFNKYSPLHDGAVIIANGRCKAAGCVLPISENPDIPDDLGLRHRSALGISEHSDAVVLVVSEETGRISLAINGRLHPYTDRKKMIAKLGQLLA